MAPRVPVGPNDPDNPLARRNQPTRPAPPRPIPTVQQPRSGPGSAAATRPRPGDVGTGTNRLGAPSESIDRPGLRRNERPAEYDAWWSERWSWWASMGWDLSNPFINNFIKEQAWLRRNTDDGGVTWISMQLEARGFQPGGLPGGGQGGYGGGGYRYGGGGGGGVSKQEQYAQAEAAVRNAVGTLGAGLDDTGIKALAKQVVDDNWSNDMLFDHLVPLAVAQPTRTGAVTTGAADIKRLANEQLLTVSDETAREWAGRIASGEMQIENVRTLLATQASQRYGWAAESIAAGLTVRDVLLPSRDRLAAELELTPASINLMDSKWLSMVQTKDDSGQTRAANDSEIIMRARKLPEWANTRAAAGLASDVTQMMRNMFGA